MAALLAMGAHAVSAAEASLVLVSSSSTASDGVRMQTWPAAGPRSPGSMLPVPVDPGRGLDVDPLTGALAAVTPDGALVIIDATLRSATRVPTAALRPRQPRWLPDGHLLWIDDRGITTRGQESCGDLWRGAPDGGSLRRLTRDGFGVDAPLVLADGRVAFLSHRPDGSSRIMQIHPDGTGLALIHGGTIPARRFTGMAVDGDGRWLVTDTDGRAWWLDPATGRDPGASVRAVTGPGSGHLRTPVRHGNRILARSDDPAAPWVVIHADGRSAAIVDPPGAEWMPGAWIPSRRAHRRPDLVDPRLPHGWIYLNDLRLGAAGAGARSIRILAKEWPAGPASAPAMTSVVGIVPAEADGSLFVRVPAEVPLALDALDADGRRIAGMDGWFTLQRGERASCIGCHVPGDRLPVGHPTAFRRPPVTTPTLRHDWRPLGASSVASALATCTPCHGADHLPSLLSRGSAGMPADHPPVTWTAEDRALVQAWMDAGRPDHGTWVDAISPKVFADPSGPWQARLRADADHLDRVRAWVMGLGGP